MKTLEHLPLPTSTYNFKFEFSLAQAQIMVAGVLGHDLSKNHVADLLRPQLLDKKSTLSIVKRTHRLDFDANELLEKLESLSLAELKAVQHLLKAVTDLDPWELFNGELPSVHVLRRFGLAPPVGSRIWGFVVVHVAGGSHFHQVVLRGGGSSMTKRGEFCKEDIAKALIRRTYELRAEPVSGPDPMLVALSYELAFLTDSRFFNVIEEEDGFGRISPISIKALRSDVEDGSLTGLVIPGVNAPPSGDS